MAFRLQYTSRAERQLDRLSHQDRGRVIRRVALLVEDPKGHRSKQLRGRPVRWSSRVGSLRIVYAVDDASQMLTIHGVGNRDSIYELMRRS